jgi:hypothetical protein
MIYTFLPCRADGSSLAFDLVECDDDAVARGVAERILRRHDSAVEVVFWTGERRAGAVSRQPA